MRVLMTFLAILGCSLPAWGDDWPQWRGPQRDGVWRETGIVEKLPAKLSRVWEAPIGAGYSGPSVADGRVYVTDRVLNEGQANPKDPFSRAPVGGVERIHCLDAKTGKPIWKHEYPCKYTISYPSGPRATPTVQDGKVFSLGAMGDFFCFEAKTGKILWQKNFPKDFGTEINIWGMSAAPLVDGQRLILLAGGTKNRGVVCLDKDTGEPIWNALEFTDPGYCAPEIIEAGGRRQLIIWSPLSLASLDPATGQVFWQQPFELKAGLSIPSPIHDPERHLLFVTAFYNGPMMMELGTDAPTAKLLWKGKSNSEIKTDGLHAILCTPVFRDGYIYGVCSYGQLRCLDAKTGARQWESFQATGQGRWWNAFIVQQGDRYFLANEQGDLIIARFSPKGYQELSRGFLIEPTNRAMRRNVVWSHPAFSNRHVFARNDNKIIAVNLGQ